jgi:uncharacterized protein (DUF342 family)
MPQPAHAPATERTSVIPVSISDDRMTAAIRVPGDWPRDAISAESFCDALGDAKVAVDDAVVAAVQRLIDRLSLLPEGEGIEAVVAEGVPPIHGVDGRVEWLARSMLDVAPDDDERVDHYERGALVLVKPGQTIARVIEPIDGENGRDVRGIELPARPGRPVHLQLDDTVVRKDDRLVAKIAGMLHRKRGRIYVSEMMELRDGVNFATGNINFHGDVAILGNVLDRFRVKAVGDVDVRGLIEAATIETGGNLHAHGGITGYPNGMLSVGGDLIARFLNRATGIVHGNLHVERECLDCDMTVGGNIDLPGGVLTGGVIRMSKHATIATLGSPHAVETVLRLSHGAKFELHITRRIHPGVHIVHGNRAYVFIDTVRGPIRILPDHDGTIVFRFGDSRPRPLACLIGVRVETV